MRELEHFWEHIAKNIEDTYQKGNPELWNKSIIDQFLIDFQSKLIVQIEQNKKVAPSLHLPELKGKIQYRHLEIPAYDAMRRIFVKKESNGRAYYQLLFAIYFGYDSVDHYIRANNLVKKGEVSTLPLYLLEREHKAPYLGLQTFALENAALFHGRNNEINKLLTYLSQDRYNNLATKNLIYLYGQTGVGKSSLLNAGLIPRLLEDWDIHYSRRDKELGLSQTFKAATKEKPILLLFDQLEYLFEQQDSKIEEELIGLFNRVFDHLQQKTVRALKIVLAVPGRNLAFVQSILKKSKINNNSISLSTESSIITAEAFAREVIKISLKFDDHFLLIPTIGEKHNLWYLLYEQVDFSFTFRYVYGNENEKLSKLFEHQIKKRKELIILDQLEEAITKPLISFYPNKLKGLENKELKDLAIVINNYLSRRKDVKVILSFRADYLAEIEDVLESRLSNMYFKILVKPLTKEGIRQAIIGPLERGSFYLKYYDDFINDMITLLTEDEESNIAPSLQIILKRLWDLVKMDSREFSKELFNIHIKKEKRIILSFLREQLAKLQKIDFP